MSKFKFLPILAGAAALGVVAFLALPQAAIAAACSGTSSELTQSDITGLATGDFGNVCITNFTSGSTSSTNTATVTFTAVGNFAFVDSNIADLNSGLITSITDFSSTPAETSGFTDTGSKEVDGFGMFTNTTKFQDASTQFSSISFTITGSFTSTADVLTANAQNFDAAAHIINLATSGPSQGVTGFAGECTTGTNCTIVPAPVIGHGLLVLLAIGGVLSGSKLLENLKKRHFHAA